MNKSSFDAFAQHSNKYQISYKNYLIEKPEDFQFDDELGSVHSGTEQDLQGEYLIYKKCNVPVKEPRIALWDYMAKPEVKLFLELKKKSETRQFIERKLQEGYPKGIPRIILRELMYSVIKFCRTSNFNLEQTGALLSQFYLTHIFFTSSLDIGAEKLYEYFKELQLCHSLPFPPHSIKLFNLEQVKRIMIYFCRLYLRNLPLIRLMSLPNFTLCANYPLEPDFLGKKGKKGKRKGKKGKKGKKKK